MKCSNCDKDALFEYRITEEKSIFYCNSDLPSFLFERKKAGSLAITQEYKDAADSALKAVTFVTTPEDVPASTVKKKTTKKTAK